MLMIEAVSLCEGKQRIGGNEKEARAQAAT